MPILDVRALSQQEFLLRSIRPIALFSRLGLTSGFTRRLTLAFMGIILVVAFTIPVAFFAFHSIRSSSLRVADTSVSLERIAQLQVSIAKMRVAARDFAESGDAQDRKRIINHLNRLTDEVHCMDAPGSCASAEYRSMPLDERERWRQLIDRASRAHSEFMAAVRVGRADRGINKFDDRMQQDVSKPADELARLVRNRGTQAQDRIARSIVSGWIMLILVLALAVITATVMAVIVTRALRLRLDSVRVPVHRLAAGDLAARAEDDIAHDDEISMLAHDFNIMASALEHRASENEALHNQLKTALMTEQERSSRDPLTSLRNHRYFHESLSSEVERCERSGAVVTIAVLDLDDFKQVNDRFGHQEGDAVLLRVTKGISDNLRPYDLACRLGGEEFGIIFPETSPDDAGSILERIAEHVRAFGPNGERSTFSAGLATFPSHAQTSADLYQRADEAAYHSKLSGKDQITIYDPRQVNSMSSAERVAQRNRETNFASAMRLVREVDSRDPYTRNHSEIAAIYAGTIARALGLDEDTVTKVYRATLVHDIGKIGIDETILLKPDALTPDEWAQTQTHPDLSYRLLRPAEIEPIATWVRHHHEHWDGSGYPQGLAGEQIPLASRIILVADAFEAMTSNRVYRQALDTDIALGELQSCSGTQFDPRIAELMIKLVNAGVFDDLHESYGKPPGRGAVPRLLDSSQRYVNLMPDTADGPQAA